MNRAELLSPAGDYNCFLAAVSSGADAVYLSGEKYGARAYAKNFTQEELIKAIKYAHIFSRKVYLTVNTLVKDDELSGLYDYLLPLYSEGLDGVIVQDMGVIAYIRNAFPDMPVHASTQLAITGIEGINLLEKEGVVRTVLAREVSLEEIKYIHDNSDMELECFIHGALCYSYSGKCLFSSLVGGRSGNRGRCAGSCRQPYNGKYLLSTKDISCLAIIPELISAGIKSFKIEGRMKSPEYVAGVTGIYRKYIDIYYNNIDTMTAEEIKNRFFTGKAFQKDYDKLTTLYTRGGNSAGYYKKHNGASMISVDSASYISDKGEVKDSVSDSINADSLKIKINGRIHISPNEEIILTINDSVSALGAVALTADNRPVDKETVRKQLTKTGDTEFEFEKIEYDIADNAFVRISDLNDLRRKALDQYRDYLLSDLKRVHSLILDRNNINNINNTRLSNEACFADTKLSSSHTGEILITCEIASRAQFDLLITKRDVSRIYVPLSLLVSDGDYYFAAAKRFCKQIYIKFHSVIRYNYLINNRELLISLIDRADGVMADSHEVIEFMREYNADITDNVNMLFIDKDDKGIESETRGINPVMTAPKPVIGDIHIYALNSMAADKYKNLGITALTVPVELNKKELYSRGITGEELIVYGYMPMMVSAQCVNRTVSSCDKKAKSIVLRDRRGAEFTAVNDCSVCSNTIYNSVPLSLHSEGDFIRKISPCALRLNFTIENTKRINDIMDYYVNLSNNNYEIPDNSKTVFRDNQFTKGHLNRGVL